MPKKTAKPEPPRSPDTIPVCECCLDRLFQSVDRLKKMSHLCAPRSMILDEIALLRRRVNELPPPKATTALTAAIAKAEPPAA